MRKEELNCHERANEETAPRGQDGCNYPKPQAKGEFKVKGWGTRRGEPARIYTIPDHSTPTRPYEKGVTEREWDRAFQ